MQFGFDLHRYSSVTLTQRVMEITQSRSGGRSPGHGRRGDTLRELCQRALSSMALGPGPSCTDVAVQRCCRGLGNSHIQPCATAQLSAAEDASGDRPRHR